MNFQKCLYCGGNIEEGTFRSGGGNYFLPKGSLVATGNFFSGESPMARRIFVSKLQNNYYTV